MSANCNCNAVSPPGPTLASTCGGSMFMLFMGVLEAFIRTQCDLNNPCDRASNRFRSTPDQEYDFIVVGGGSAGSVVASRLSEVPDFKVLVIEAGGDEPVGAQIPSMFTNYIGSEIDWNFETEPETQACLSNKNKRCKWPRGKVLGGTSVLYGMMYMRGNPKDYNDWESMGNPGWNYKDVLPYFLKSENNLDFRDAGNEYHKTGGLMPVGRFPYAPPMTQAILRAGEDLGYQVHDLNGANSTGFTIAQMVSKGGVRMSSARAFLRPARFRTNLDILLKTYVTKVLVEPSTKSAYGVEVVDQNGNKRRIMARKEVIVCGGAINSPQILLLSGIGPKEDLEKVNVEVIHNLPGVGKNLHNHVSFITNYFINQSDTRSLNWATAMEYMLNRDGLMSGTGITQATAKITTKYAEDPASPDLQIFFNGFLANCSKTGQIGELLSNHDRIIQIAPLTIDPKSRGYLTLRSNDPLQPPKIVANYFADEIDLNTLVEGIKIGIRISETAPLKAYGMRLDKTPHEKCKNIEFGTDEYWKCAIRHDTAPENHQSGSCKMGPSKDYYAVVDQELKVHGVKKLRVIDASIMPKVVTANPYATIVMIAEKGSDAIKKKYNVM